MHRFTSQLCSVVGLALLAPLTLAAENRLDESRSVFSKWVQTRQLIAREKSEWTTERETLQQSIALFEKELARLDQEISSTATNQTQAAKEHAELDHQNQALIAAQEKLAGLAADLERQIRAAAPLFPEPVLDKIQPLLKRIPDDPAHTKAPVTERLQNLVGILNETDKFNGAVSVFSEIRRTASGSEVQVKTLYVGLARAFFVDKNGDYAGVGVPTAAGWKWETRPELASRISQAIAIYENSSPATFVALPMSVR